MSAIKIQPPQTYSRLFRPWDSSKTSQTAIDNFQSSQNNNLQMVTKSNKDNNLIKSPTNVMDINTQIYNGICNSSISMPIMDEIPTAPYLVDNYALENIYNQNACFSANNPYYLGGLVTTAQPLMGMDPLTLTIMEQEYARVIAEDAQTKALNSRKQRPKKFKCPHCDVAFSNNGQLKGHIRIHTGERPFKCDLESCGKTFTRNEELTRHKRIHTGIRPFGCTVCGKKFGRRDHLKKHMKTHMPQEKHLGPAIFVPMYPYLYGC